LIHSSLRGRTQLQLRNSGQAYVICAAGFDSDVVSRFAHLVLEILPSPELRAPLDMHPRIWVLSILYPRGEHT